MIKPLVGPLPGGINLAELSKLVDYRTVNDKLVDYRTVNVR